MFDELDKQLRDLEARLHEARHLLSAASGGRAEGKLPGGAVYEIAALLLAAKSASEAGESLCRTLRAAALRPAPATHAPDDSVQSDLNSALGLPNTEAPRFPRPDQLPPSPNEGSGGAFIGALTPRPRPLLPAGAAARRFDESDAPPRNP